MEWTLATRTVGSTVFASLSLTVGEVLDAWVGDPSLAAWWSDRLRGRRQDHLVPRPGRP
ncbi:MAG: hypothetical protein ABMA64_23710 [Myxococcota bacterium]